MIFTNYIDFLAYRYFSCTDDVGALSDIRRELQMAVLEPIRSREKYEAMGMHSPAGILLYG